MAHMILISNKSEATLFKTVGFLVHIVSDEDEVREIIDDLNKEIKLIAYDSDYELVISHYKNKQTALYPLYLALPLNKDKVGNKVAEIRESIKKSIGIDLL